MNARSSFSRGTLGSQPTSFTRGTLGQPFRPSSYAMPAAPAARPAAAPAMPAARAAAPAMPAMPAARPVSAAPNWAGIPSARQSAVSNPLTGRPMGTEGLGRPLGAPAPRSTTPRADTSNLRGNNPLTGRPMGTEGLGRPLGAPVPFGGFFAEGGVAPAGAASIVGERGPEIIVPQAPTTVIPIRMPGQREESMPAPAMNQSGVDQVKLGQDAAMYRAEADARWNDYMNNTDPAKDAGLRDSYRLSRDLATSLTRSYENPDMPVQAARIVNSGLGMDRAGATGLAGAPRRQIGRSANDPMRIAEQQRRRGNIRPIMQLGQMAMEQQARQAQDAANFAQQSAMFQAQQQVVNQRDASQWSQQQQLEAMRNAEAAKRDTANFQQQQQIESDRRAYENAQQLRKEQAGKIVRFENMPTPDGKGFIPVAVRADGSYDMAGGYMPSRTDEPQGWQKIEGTDMYMMTGRGSEKFDGQTWRKEGDRYVPNVAPAEPKVQTVTLEDGTRVTMQRNPQTGQWESLPMPATSTPPAGGAANPALDRLRRLQGQ